MNHIFFEITLVLILATLSGMIARALKQPTIVGYILTGIIVGPLGLVRLNNADVLDAMAQFGIAFLLFLVGMEMNFGELRHVGKSVLAIGLGQVVFTALVGLAIASALGFALVPALYLAVALTFSSTIIVVKLLSEKSALESLYGKIVVGVLLVQDFIALGFLVLLSGLAHAGNDPTRVPWGELVDTFAKGALLLVASLAVGKWMMPRLLRRLASSQEVLFLASLAWGLGVAALAALPAVGLTIEIGAFLAGIALAESVEHFQIAGRVKSLRDFFVVMFFIVLGSRMALGGQSGVWGPTVLLSLFVLVGNPLIVMLIMGALGFRSRTGFMAGVTVAQISEFSLIVVTLGHRLGHVDQRVVTIVTAVGLITITLSSYLILYSDRLYAWLRGPLKIFEFRASREHAQAEHPLKNHIVLIGCHRMGHNILHSIEDLHKEFVVIDFNPDVIAKLHRRGVHALYGDAADPDIQERAAIDRARLVVSTVPTLQDSLNLLARAKGLNPRVKVIVTAETEVEALELYEHGADYVLLPHFIGGLQLAKTIEEDSTLRSLARLREQDLSVIAHT
jgi:Kef-type K+ transport system membrane component KefB